MTSVELVELTEHNGRVTLRTVCQDCQAPVTLPCDDIDPRQLGERQRRILFRFAAMTICTRCAEEADKARTRVQHRQGMAERAHRSGVPVAFRNLTFDEMIRSGKRAAAIDAAREWAEAGHHQARGLLLWGGFGTGKSRLAATACWHRLQHHPVRWCSVSLLIATLQAAFDNDERKRALAMLTGRDALVLDDLDKVTPTEHVRSQLFVAIDRRINEQAPLLITTNVPPGDLKARFGEAITSRLTGYCGLWTFEMDGPDRRMEL